MSHAPLPRLRRLLAGAALVLVLAGCSDDAGAPVAAGGSSVTSEGADDPDAARFCEAWAALEGTRFEDEASATAYVAAAEELATVAPPVLAEELAQVAVDARRAAELAAAVDFDEAAVSDLSPGELDELGEVADRLEQLSTGPAAAHAFATCSDVEDPAFELGCVEQGFQPVGNAITDDGVVPPPLDPVTDPLAHAEGGLAANDAVELRHRDVEDGVEVAYLDGDGRTVARREYHRRPDGGWDEPTTFTCIDG